jgi:MATE family multidrug resistance protein
LAGPIAVSLLSFSIMTAVDTLFVGHLGPAALAGVALGGTTTFTLICFGFGLLRATNITISQAVGAGQRHAIEAYLGASLVLAFGIGIVTAFAGQIVAVFLPLLTVGEGSGHYATEYARVRFLGAPIQLTTIALSGARYAIGDSRSPMRAVLTANAANVVFVAMFVVVFDAGVAGVATATVFAQMVEVFMLARRQRREGFGLRSWTFADMRVLLRLGVPLGIERFFDVGSFSLMVAVFARMGDLELASHQVAHQAMLFGFMMNVAIGDANSVLVGQAVGAASLRTVPRVQRAALTAGLSYVAILATAFLFFGHPIASLFTNDPSVIARAAQLLQIGAVFVWALPFYAVGQGTLRAVGDVRAAALITVIAAWVCTPLLGALFGLHFGLGARGGWIGIACEVILAAGAFWWRLRGGGWLRSARRVRSELRLDARMREVATVQA